MITAAIFPFWKAERIYLSIFDECIGFMTYLAVLSGGGMHITIWNKS